MNVNMKVKKILVFAIVIMMLAVSVGVVSAQDGSNEGRSGDRLSERIGEQQRPFARGLTNVIGLVSEQIDLDAREIAMQIRDGATLGEVITASGGDVETVTATVIDEIILNVEEALAEERITQEQADRVLANVEENVNAAMTGDLREVLQDRGSQNIRERLMATAMGIVVEATGLDRQEIAEQVRDGATLAELITANGGDVDAVITESVTALTERVNEAVANGNLDEDRAAELLENAEQTITEMVNGELRGRLGDRGPQRDLQVGVRAVRQSVSEATGLNQREIQQALRDGATLESLLTDNGVDVDVFTTEQTAAFEARVNEAVANGNLTEDRAATLIDGFAERLDTLLTRSRI